MSTINTLINLHGLDVEIYRETKGDVDDYGDRTVSWDRVSAEKAMIQPAFSIRTSRVLASIAGRIDSSDFLGIFKSNSAIQTHDNVECLGTKYEVMRTMSASLFGSVSHIEAHLRIMSEG
ncbi:MAG: hypothetical protein ACTSPB_02495 [Candidatus Thorarchaeota archaeon]